MHATLLVSSAKSEADRARQPVGELLAAQLASNAAPLLMNKDSVGLGLMADRFGKTPGVLNLKIVGADAQALATGGNAPTLSGQAFQAPVTLEDKALGSVEVTLAGSPRGEILRNSGWQMLTSLLLHVLFGSWLIWPERFRSLRVPILQPLPPLRRRGAVEAPAPEVVIELPPAASVFLQVALEDSKSLLQRVNASTADQMLVILEKLLARSARLYRGKVLHTFGPEGATVRFDGDDEADCLQRALSCGRLFLKLADTAYQQRRNAKLFALPVKAAIMPLAEREEGVVLDELMQLARRGTAQSLLLPAVLRGLDALQSSLQLESLAPPPPEPAGEDATATETVTDTDAQGEEDKESSDEPKATSTEAAPEGDAQPEEKPEPEVYPWKVVSLSEADESRIQEQKQQILERKKPAAGETAAA
ncbi:MAG TPA: hypothetical protein VFW42_08855 [Fluviicoccus sp.]|nr:hypothetical protein [Fluviicoccus sp.]